MLQPTDSRRGRAFHQENQSEAFMAKIRFGIDRSPGDRSTAVSDWKLAALVFFDPKFATSEGIINVLSLLDTFSGDHIDITLHGYREDVPESIDPMDLEDYAVQNIRKKR
jgi:hypothetical protein